jgi:hypothetical protein
MSVKLSEAEVVRRLQEVAEDERKYFPGVLGNPVIYAARWGLPLSKSYQAAKAKELRALKRRVSKGKRSSGSRRA